MSAPRRFVVILNASSGGGNDHALVDRLAAFFSKADPRADSTIRLVHGAGEIAEALKVSIKTVEYHKSRIMAHLNIHTAAGLTRYAIDRGIVAV